MGGVHGPYPTVHAARTTGDKTLCGQVIEEIIDSSWIGNWTCERCKQLVDFPTDPEEA